MNWIDHSKHQKKSDHLGRKKKKKILKGGRTRLLSGGGKTYSILPLIRGYKGCSTGLPGKSYERGMSAIERYRNNSPVS